jgi:hypothetical protein
MTTLAIAHEVGHEHEHVVIFYFYSCGCVFEWFRDGGHRAYALRPR